MMPKPFIAPFSLSLPHKVEKIIFSSFEAFKYFDNNLQNKDFGQY
jgi:hypothetical protein